MENRHVLSYQEKLDPERFRLVDNRAIVIPETIDAIWALTEMVSNAEKSIVKTNATLGVGLPIEVLGQR